MKAIMDWCALGDLVSYDYFQVSFFIRYIELIIEQNADTTWGSSMHFTRRFEYPWCIIHAGVNEMPKRCDEVVLDAGGGSTSFSFFLSKKYREVHVVDIDENAIQKMQEMKEKLTGFDNLLFGTQDILHMGYKDLFFDTTFCISVLEHGPVNHHVSDAIHELLRVTRKKVLLTLDVGYKFGDAGPLDLKTLYQLSEEFNFDVPQYPLDCFSQKLGDYEFSVACIEIEKENL